MDIKKAMQLYELRSYLEEKRAEQSELEKRFNKYHDPRNGRFTNASGGGGAPLIIGAHDKTYKSDVKKYGEAAKLARTMSEADIRKAFDEYQERESKARKKLANARGKAAKEKATQELEAISKETQKYYTALKINHDLQIAEDELAWSRKQKAKAEAEHKKQQKSIGNEIQAAKKYGQLSFF